MVDIAALAAAGETVSVEFKRGTPGALNDTDLVAAVACMANGPGGVILVGIDDNGHITGAAPRHGTHTDPYRLRALILNRTTPALSTEVEVVRLDEGEVIVISVPPSPTPVGTSQGLFTRRALRQDGKPQCVPFQAHELMSAQFSFSGADYAEATTHVPFGDLDRLELERFRRMAKRPGGDGHLADLSDVEIARALGAVRQDGGIQMATIGGVLLFGRPETIAREVPTAEVAFQELDGTDVRANEIGYLPLLRAMEDIGARLEARNTEQEVSWGLFRLSVERIPTDAAREAIANALVHRDYTQLGGVRVALNGNRFVVTSGGGLPRGVTLANLLEVTMPRSRTLADAFKRAGLVERTGRGVGRMFDAMLRSGRDVPDYSQTSDRAVVVSLPVGAVDVELVRFIVDSEERGGRRYPLTALRVLHELRVEGEASAAELEVVVADRDIRATLQDLVAAGAVDARGYGRARTYALSSAFYRLADERPRYVRLRGADQLQQEQMILGYVDEYGSITRAEAADLCLLTPARASATLRRMTKSGTLSMAGERRTAKYVRRDH